MFLLLAAVAAILFLVRPGVGRLKARVTRSMSMALGRQVEMSSVRLHVLPQPGFDFENLVVHDDPAMSAEPMLRAGEVSAALRLSSLLRGRIEISRLSLNEPSLNLVRSPNGRWNIEDLLEHAARIPSAPTVKSRSEARPGFPYIEASRARVNFKLGREKKAFALTDAELTLWQESEDAWGVRLRAVPIRTDFNISDTGLLRLNGIWRRAQDLRDTPLQISLDWDGAQLGQVTKLIFGADRGWRGGVRFSITASGVPADLSIASQASLQDFRRYDIAAADSMQMSTQCKARYTSTARSLREILCESRVGEGQLRLSGEIHDPLGMDSYSLSLSAQDISAQDLVRLARRAKRNLPEALVAKGTVEGTLTARKSASETAVLGGEGQISKLQVGDGESDTIQIGTLDFVAGPSSPSVRIPSPQPNDVILSFLPVQFAMGRSTVVGKGWISKSNYEFSLQGEAQLRNLLHLARLAGLSSAKPAADGAAKVDFKASGPWAGFATAELAGTAQLRGIRAEIRGTSSPIEIASGQLTLSRNVTTLEKLSASAAGSHFTGKVVVPRRCDTPENCHAHFDLYADAIASEKINTFFSSAATKRPWYRILSRNPSGGPSPLLSLQAEGSLHVGHFTLRNLDVNGIACGVEIDKGKVRFVNLRAAMWGGTYQGDVTADFSAKLPAYAASGKFENVALAELSSLMERPWISGNASGAIQFESFGNNAKVLIENGEGSLDFEVDDGMFSNLTFGESVVPVVIQRFSGKVLLRDGRFEVRDGKLLTPDSTYLVSGRVSADSDLDIKLEKRGGGYSISGTLAEPRAIAINRETQAALKP